MLEKHYSFVDKIYLIAYTYIVSDSVTNYLLHECSGDMKSYSLLTNWRVQVYVCGGRGIRVGKISYYPNLSSWGQNLLTFGILTGRNTQVGISHNNLLTP